MSNSFVGAYEPSASARVPPPILHLPKATLEPKKKVDMEEEQVVVVAEDRAGDLIQ